MLNKLSNTTRAALPVVAGALSILALSATAKAEVAVDVDLSTQTMHVASAQGEFNWPVSTARAGFVTPRGRFAPTGLERMHYSKKYHNSPMPYSIFFRGGYAIHGTYATGALGTPASHGCVRLSPEHARQLYEMVRREGASISITGSPRGARYASR
jgi:lipoprotein-anchoring transpeptidase ErfK/SrfK